MAVLMWECVECSKTAPNKKVLFVLLTIERGVDRVQSHSLWVTIIAET